MVIIYALTNPVTNKIFYVGASKKNPRHRLMDHKRNNSLPSIAQLKEASIEPIVKTLEVVSREEAKEREAYWIKSFLQAGEELENVVLVSNYSPKPHNVGIGIEKLREEKRLEKKSRPRKFHTKYPLD